MATKTQKKIYINNEGEKATDLHVEFGKFSGVTKVVSATQDPKKFKDQKIDGKTVDLSGGEVKPGEDVTVTFTLECDDAEKCDPDQQEWWWTVNDDKSSNNNGKQRLKVGSRSRRPRKLATK